MKYKTVTIALPINLVEFINARAKKGERSSFVVKIIEKVLAQEAQNLKNAYRMANKDPDRLQTLHDWRDI